MPSGQPKIVDARSLAFLVGAVLLLTVPFLHKPFNIDDDVYIKGAEQILRDPLHPLGGTQRIFGQVMPTYHFTQHPPLVSYYIALAIRLTGRADEPTLHAAFLPFAIAAAIALYLLARRFTSLPLSTSLLFVASPAFLVMAHGIMTDIPFLALYLGATAAFVYGIDRNRPALLVVSATLLVLLCLTQYRGVVLMPLLAGYAVLRRRAIRDAILVCLPAAVVVSLWCLYTWRDLGVVHPLDAGSWIEFRWTRVAADTIAYVSFLGGATLFPAFLIYAAHTRRSAMWIAGTTALTTLAVATLVLGYTTLQGALLAVSVASGSTTLWMLVPERAWYRGLGSLAPRAGGDADAVRDDVLLLALAVIPLLSQVALNIFASVRSLLLALPFIVLWLVRSLERKASPRATAAASWIGVVFTAGLGLVLAFVDQQFAEASRDVAVQASAYRPTAGGRAWFTGEWGLRHYLEEEGYTSITRGDLLAEGDILLIPEVSCPADMSTELKVRLTPLGSISGRGGAGLTTMSSRDWAGFYSNFWGPLPYAPASRPLERAHVFRVRAPRHREETMLP